MARSKEKVEEASGEKGDSVPAENAEDESRMGRQHQSSKQDDEVCFYFLATVFICLRVNSHTCLYLLL
jgi:hypothetical protein